MAGHQLNVRLSPEDDAELCSWAAETGRERIALAKDVFREALAARREGRAMFDRSEVLGPADVAAALRALDQGVMEIDRIAKTWAAHETKIHKLERDDQKAMARAREEFIAGMPARIGNSLNPIRKEMEELANHIDKQPRLDDIDTRLQELKQAQEANTAQLTAIEKQPRRVTGIVLGDGGVWSTGFLCLWTIAAMLIGWTVLVPIFRITPANTIVASGLLADDAAMCGLIERRYGQRDCQVPALRRIPRTSSETRVPARKGASR